MKKLICLILALISFAMPCIAEEYSDGVYRGFYYDGGIEQLAIQFEMENGTFKSIVFRAVRYKDGNYMSVDASDAQKAAFAQFLQLADHLIGKDVKAINDLYTPYDFVDDVDAVTSATINSAKLISALWDGLNRHPYKLSAGTRLPTASEYADGIYRGSYMESGTEQVSVELVIRDGRYTSVSYRALQYNGQDFLSEDLPEDLQKIKSQFQQLTEYLAGKPIEAINDLYLPGNIATDTDAGTSATLRAPKVISAVWDALNRGGWQKTSR